MNNGNFRYLRLLLVLCFFSLGGSLLAQSFKWCAITDKAEIYDVMDIDFLMAEEGSSTLCICFKNGAMIQKVKSLTLDYRDAHTISAIEDVAANPDEVVILHNVISVTGASEGSIMHITDLNGNIWWSGLFEGSGIEIDIRALPAGCYVFSNGRNAIKFMKR